MALDLNLLLLYALTVIVMIAIPGPVAVLVVSAGLAGGARRALLTIAGTNAASLVLILLSALMVRGVLAVDATLFSVVKLLGALYIGYIGAGLLREAPFDGAPAGSGRAGGFGRGFTVALSNPKDIIFFASFFPQFIAVTPHAGASLLVLTLLWVALDFATLMLMSHLVSRLSRPRVQQALLRGSGVLLMGIAAFGIWMAVTDLVA